jgi:hypothetical protein
MRVGRLRRVGLAAVAVAVLAVGSASGALMPMGGVGVSAGPAVGGTLQGGSEWAPAVQHCDVTPVSSLAVHGTFNASFIGRGTYSGTITRTSEGSCPFSFGPGPAFPVGGTLTFRGPGGSFVTTIDSGSTGAASETPHTAGYDFNLLLSVSNGTQRYARAGGTFTLSYSTTVNFSSGCPCSAADSGTLTGSVSPSASVGT